MANWKPLLTVLSAPLCALALSGCSPDASQSSDDTASMSGEPTEAGAGAAPASPADTAGAKPGDTAGPEAAAKLPEDPQPALWIARDADTTVYLFGTVHILKPELDWRTERFDDALEAADAVYFEADVTGEAAQREMAALVPKLGTFQDGRKLSDVLDESQEKELAEALDVIGVPMMSVEPMKPWLASLQLSVAAFQKQGYDANSGVEMVLTEAVNEAGKPMRFLETGEQQLRFFADMSMEDQVGFLISSAEQIDEDPGLLDRLVAEWAEGDVDALGEMLADPEALGGKAVYDTLLVARNENWADQITTLMEAEAGTFLIAVGAGHLAGNDSLVGMLRADGVEISTP